MHHKTIYYYLLLLFAMSFCTQAANKCPESLAKVISFQGKVDIQNPNEYNWKSLEKDYTFCFGDKIRTSKNSRATLKFKNNTRVTLDQNSTLTFSVDDENDSSWINDLIKGSVFFRSRDKQILPVKSPWMNVVHKGTEFLVTVDSEQTKVTVFDGQVSASNSMGEILVEKGFTGIAGKNQAPRIQALTIRPEDAVQWSLYYPPIIDYRKIGTSEGASLQSSINANLQNNPYKALTLMNTIPASQQDADHLTLKSSLLLMFGSVEEAIKLIDQALVLESDNSTAIALQSIIAVTKNRQDKALSLAKNAVKHDPKSAVAQIALSYAYQSKFDIKSALKATKEAVRLSPDNALAWARLSELQLSTGERSDALKSAKTAQALNPKLGRTQTILGFASLARVDIDEANTAFTQAITLDSADPLAHLGLGLAKIRKGDIEEGTGDIETAVSLDPDNAIMRSYLGKSYYELKNDGYAATELTIAKEKDSKDPTPWFYDAIRKQTTNRPVEALHDMQKAIELNDNRGVYRSKLLLDEDLAARSASLGRIYNDSNFQQLGLVEGWKSVNKDPSNHSAHRLLADNYSALPRHEIARVSELLQSQLLQPINITPVQPQLAESNLQILTGFGPADLSFNEFNPLFARNRLGFQTSGIYGSNNTWGDEVTLSGLWNKFSFSLGQFHYETDGFRENNDLIQDIYTGFFQLQLTPNLNIQSEFRYNDTESGDLRLKFNPKNFSRTDRNKIRKKSGRVGFNYMIHPHHNIIGSFIYQNRDSKLNKELILANDPFFQLKDLLNIDSETKSFSAELEYLFNSENFNFILGGGYFDQSRTDNETGIEIEVFPPDPPEMFPLDPRIDDFDTENWNSFFYSSIRLFDRLTTTIGASYDSFSRNDLDIMRFNPKFGFTWEILPTTTIRAAAFRTLKRPFIADQTIEPTQIAGFNQFFDDISGTKADRLGFALDNKFSSSLSGGIEFSWRNLKIPIFNENKSTSFSDQDEQLHQGYLYWTPIDQIALGVRYEIERFENPVIDNTLLKVTNYRIPISANYFHSNGLFIGSTATFVNQKVNIIQDTNSDSFWIIDLNLGYRLPNRWGLVSFGIKNLLNQNFNYEDLNTQATDPRNPLFQPERTLFGNITLAF